MAVTNASRRPVAYSLTGLNPYPWISWWYYAAAPQAPTSAEDLPLKTREFLRRGKLASIALLIEFIELAFQAVFSFHDGTNSFRFILLSIVFMCGALVLNRTGRLTLAGLLIMFVLEAGMVSAIALPPSIPLTLAQIPFFFLLTQPLLISVLLFPAWAVLIVAAINMIATVLMLNFLPRTPEFQAYIVAHGGPVFGLTLILQLLIALVSYIVISSLQESLKRADRAEEITKLQQVMAEQSSRELTTKRQLEADVNEIVNGLTRFSNGDNSSRIRLDQGTSLWSVAATLNNMISRFVRLREQEGPREQTLLAVRAYLRELQAAQLTGNPLRDLRSGTEVDTLVREVLRYSYTPRRPQQDNQYTPNTHNTRNTHNTQP